MRLSALVIALMLSNLNLMAQDALPSSPYDIVDVKVVEIENNQKTQFLQAYTDPREVIAITRQFIALGKEIYEIIEAGRPVYNNAQATPLAILPKDEKGEVVEAMQLEGWKAPKSKKYKVEFKNGFGATPVSFTFMLIYGYGGSYNGSGAYITGAQIMPTDVSVSWGYSVDASFKVHSIMNQGTSDNPVASAVLQLNYQVSTVLKTVDKKVTFHINGLGQTTKY
jgi:hypothetical protein